MSALTKRRPGVAVWAAAGTDPVAIVERVQSGDYLVEMLSQLRQLLDEFRQGRSGRRASIRFSVRNLAHRRPAASLLAALPDAQDPIYATTKLRPQAWRAISQGQPHDDNPVARGAFPQGSGTVTVMGIGSVLVETAVVVATTVTRCVTVTILVSVTWWETVRGCPGTVTTTLPGDDLVASDGTHDGPNTIRRIDGLSPQHCLSLRGKSAETPMRDHVSLLAHAYSLPHGDDSGVRRSRSAGDRAGGEEAAKRQRGDQEKPGDQLAVIEVPKLF